jgi:hypothetical protein
MRRITSFDLEQLRRAYERHLGLFMVDALNRRDDRPWSNSANDGTRPYDNNAVILDADGLSGDPGDVSGLTSSIEP